APAADVLADLAALVERHWMIQPVSVQGRFEPDRAGADHGDAWNLGLGHESLLLWRPCQEPGLTAAAQPCSALSTPPPAAAAPFRAPSCCCAPSAARSRRPRMPAPSARSRSIRSPG